MLKQLKETVCQANKDLEKYNLVTFTWGNVSGINREKNLVVIKPSGVTYEELSPEQMVVVNLDGDVVEGELNPSSDTPTHIELYKEFSDIGGVVHTHSPWAVSFAQAGRRIEAAGTTHADYFYGGIPVTRSMREKEVKEEYEKNTGKVIIETFRNNEINPNEIPGVLVNDHGPFTWGKNADDALYHSVVLEEVAKMYYKTLQLDSGSTKINNFLLDKHYLRKHGENAYYGQ